MTNFRNVTTPWGRSQGGSLLAPGITLYHTASHGGVKVIKSQNLQIPAAFRNEDGWYEEDCESLIPFYFRFEQILEHCLQQGLDGWTISAEEYFAKYTKAYFREQVRVSFPVRYAYH